MTFELHHLQVDAAPPGAEDWAFTRHSRLVVRGGIRWHVQVTGSGPGLLLVHGTGASSHSFRELMPLLASRFTVVAPDLPGHALTEAPSRFAPSLPVIAAALEELLAALDIVPAVAVGHSAGAALIARMTLEHAIQPQLLVGLGAALTPFRGVARALFPSTALALSLASKLVPLRLGDESHVKRLLLRTGSSLDRSGVELYRRLSARPSHVAGTLAMMAHWDLEPLHEDLPTLRVPLLLLAGERDRAVSVAQQRDAASRVSGARVVVVEGAGHLLHEEQPGTVARLITGEVDAVLRAATRR